MNQAEYLSLTQASVRSGLSVWKLRRLIDEGKLQGTRSPRGDRIVEAKDLSRLLDAHER